MSELMSKMIQKDIDMLQDKIERIQKENELLRNCLEFYADKDSYAQREKDKFDWLHGDTEYLNEDEFDLEGFYSGKKAREYLSKLGER